MSYAVVGVLLGISCFLFLMWIAGRMERERPGPEGANLARVLRVMAYVDLVVIPLLMYHFGASVER